MARKHVAVHVPTQMGFGFDVQDNQGKAPKFLWRSDEVYAAIDAITQAHWVSTDVETTGLTDASIPVALSPSEVKQGGSNVVRLRTIQARIPTEMGRRGPRQDFVFDVDRMGPKLAQEVARAILSRRMFIAHNAGFDLYWLRYVEGRQTMPALVVDTMLMTRLLSPELVLARAELIKDIRNVADLETASAQARAAWKSLIGGASGGSLADVVLAMFNVVVDKTYQKPSNWVGLLGFEHYNYANDDTYWADRILCKLLGVDDDGDQLRAYLVHRARLSTVRLIEPQVPELVLLRERGMPIDIDVGQRYVQRKRIELAKKVRELISIEESLATHEDVLSDPNAGLDEELKHALAKAFEARGVVLRRTAETGAPQVGEKDLRACKAMQITEARPLFQAWVAVSRAKKSSNMALEIVGFVKRGGDRRIRALLSHGPVTGRLAAAEPNVQQFPRDQLFRALCVSPTKPGCEFIEFMATELTAEFLSSVADTVVEPGDTVCLRSAWMAAMFWADKKVPDWPAAEKNAMEQRITAQFTHLIVASDFGALDVRVGAALCIRSQREMLALAKGSAVPGPVQPPEKVVEVIHRVAAMLEAPQAQEALDSQMLAFEREVTRLEKRLAQLAEALEADQISRKVYFSRRRDLKEELLAAKLGWRFSQCLALGHARGEREYSALRDAFVADIDIHTFTGMKLVGRDPMKEFDGRSVADRKALEKKLKKELGPRRQQGKIANLSLLYGMADAGFQEAAARGYDEHWSMEEAHDIRALWMNAYPEVELWHLWTECLQVGVVYVPEKGREKPVRTGWWLARTLAGRDIVAHGLNAALSYQDQSSGADILGLIMHKLKEEYPPIFDCAINQVHDELVLQFPVEHHDLYLPIVERVMVECANSQTMLYGVPTAVSPACGPIWVKD